MSISRLILIGIAAAGLAGCNLATPTGSTAQPSPPSKAGTWQLVATSDAVVWKINTETGETRRCVDGMVEKACVLANDVDSVLQLKPNPSTPPPATESTLPEPAPQDGRSMAPVSEPAAPASAAP